MRRLAPVLLGVSWADPASAQVVEQAIARARAMTGAKGCAVDAGTNERDAIVCASRAATDRYRLPLPVDRSTDPVGGPVKGEPMSGAAALVPFAECGPFAGQRSCSKAEAWRYGYGGGRDPLSFGVKLFTKLLDPDADLGPVPPPPPKPRR